MIWINLARILIPGLIFGLLLGKFLQKRPGYIQLMNFRTWKEKAVRFSKKKWLRIVTLSLAFGISSFYIVQATYMLMEEFWVVPISEDNIFSMIPLPLLIVSIAVVPVVEEWIFRGVLLEELSRIGKSKLIGLVASSLLFALFHLSNPGTRLSAVPPYLVAGLMIGGSYLAGGLSVATFTHILYNLYPYLVAIFALIF